jgi:hypothetical protein
MQWKATLALVLGIWFAHGVPLLAYQCGHHHCGNDGDCYDDDCHGCGHHSSYSRRAVSPDEGRSARVRAPEQSREGKVVEVVYLPGSTKDTAMVEIRLMVGTERIQARLGPTGFLKQNQMDVHEGDTVSLTGYWVTAGDGEMLVVNRVTKQGKMLQLRDGWGRSAW